MDQIVRDDACDLHVRGADRRASPGRERSEIGLSWIGDNTTTCGLPKLTRCACGPLSATGCGEGGAANVTAMPAPSLRAVTVPPGNEINGFTAVAVQEIARDAPRAFSARLVERAIRVVDHDGPASSLRGADKTRMPSAPIPRRRSQI